MDIEIKDIRKSMKQIIEQTNDILKHSSTAFKKTKEQFIVLNKIKMKPNEKTKEWFSQKNIKKITIPDFFDLIFSEASTKNLLNFNNKTIIFDDNDASIFGFEPNVEINILTLFENIPKYFQ